MVESAPPFVKGSETLKKVIINLKMHVKKLLSFHEV